jgi:drug/metabolite transporter (DMT)-like permease
MSSSRPRDETGTPKTIALFAVVAAAVLWSTGGFFGKLSLWDSWPKESRGVLLAFWRALFAGLLILPAVRRVSWRWSMAPMSICFAAMNGLYLTALSITTGANAIWLQNTAPWWVFLAGALWLREPVRRRDLIPLFCCIVGVCTILVFELRAGVNWGVICALGSAFGYAAVVMLLRELRSEDSAWLVAVNHLITAAILFAPTALLGLWPNGIQLLALAAFGFVQMALPYLLFGWGLKRISSNEAIAIGLLEPILLPVWAYLTRSEIPAWWTIAGASIILAGLVVRYGVMRAAETPVHVNGDPSA